MGVAEAHQAVEAGGPEAVLVTSHQGPGEQVRDGGQVEDIITNGHSDPVSGLLGGAEHAIGQVLEGEVGVLSDVNPCVVHDERLG